MIDIDQLKFIGRELQGPECVRAAADRKLENISSLAFGGPDLKTVHLGCLSGESLDTFQSAIAELPPCHWTLTARESVRA